MHTNGYQRHQEEVKGGSELLYNAVLIGGKKNGKVSNNESPLHSYANKMWYLCAQDFKASLKEMAKQWCTDGIKISFESDSP